MIRISKRDTVSSRMIKDKSSHLKILYHNVKTTSQMTNKCEVNSSKAPTKTTMNLVWIQRNPTSNQILSWRNLVKKELSRKKNHLRQSSTTQIQNRTRFILFKGSKEPTFAFIRELWLKLPSRPGLKHPATTNNHFLMIE